MEVEFCPTCDRGPLRLHWRFTNKTKNEIVLAYSNDNFTAQDNLGNPLDAIFRNHNAIGAAASVSEHSVFLKRGESFDFLEMSNFRDYLAVFADIADKQVSEVIVTVSGVSQIETACWRIPINH